MFGQCCQYNYFTSICVIAQPEMGSLQGTGTEV